MKRLSVRSREISTSICRNAQKRHHAKGTIRDLRRKLRSGRSTELGCLRTDRDLLHPCWKALILPTRRHTRRMTGQAFTLTPARSRFLRHQRLFSRIRPRPGQHEGCQLQSGPNYSRAQDRLRRQSLQIEVDQFRQLRRWAAYLR